MLDFNEISESVDELDAEQLDALEVRIKARKTLLKKEVTASKKTSGIDMIRGSDAGTVIRFLRGSGKDVVEMEAPIAENKDKTAAFGPKGTTVSVMIEGKKCPIQGQRIVGFALAV